MAARVWPLWRVVLSIATLAAVEQSSTSTAAEASTNAAFQAIPLSVPERGQPGFTKLDPSRTGILFTNVLPVSRYGTNQIFLNGSGVAAGDVDGDGWCDLYFAAIDRPGALYRNLGSWRFEDITTRAGLPGPEIAGTGAAFADIDGDADLDLLINSVGHGTHVLLNNGKGAFTRSSVLNPGKGGMSLALGDLDGDGFLDLYITNYRTSALMDMPNTRFNFSMVNGQRVIARVNNRPVTEPDLTNRFRLTAKGGIEENGELDVLYRNAGGREFKAVSFTDGSFLDEDGQPLKQPPFEWGLSVQMRDLNQDGLPDIYVCNDFDSPERIWINQGQGRFRAAPRLAFRKSSLFSMGVDVGDINRDGFDDVVTLDMLARDHAMRMDMMGDRKAPVPQVGQFDNRPEYMMNALFLNRGDNTYAEIAQLSGVAASDWAWAVLFLDVDLDGYEDLLITNGNERKARSMDIAERLRQIRATRQLSAAEVFEARKIFPRQESSSVVYRNRGDLTFEDRSDAWGFNFHGVSHGMALADLDNDGDLDVLVNHANAAAGIYQNNSSAPRLAVRLKGAAPNTRGIGARITVSGGPLPVQSQEILAGGRYLSSDDPMRTFAAGSLTNPLVIEVAWRNGGRSRVTGARPNHLYQIGESAAAPATSGIRPSPSPKPLFEDVSARLAHRHSDEPFDDFAQQPMLQHQLSQLGPGVTWFDLNVDGRDDLVIASGKGGQMAAFANDGAGAFKPLSEAPFTTAVTRDQTTVLPWRRMDGSLALLAGSANYEDGLTNGSVVRAFDLASRAIVESLPGAPSSTGPMALADVDRDGVLDLFVGGRVISSRYPEPASSQLFRGTGKGFELDRENSAAMANLGMAVGAVWSDLDEDGDPDLAVTTEWGPLRLFRNTQGRLVAWDPEVALPRGRAPMSTLRGLWTGVSAGDFDGDGRMDLAVANWGRNSRFSVTGGRGPELVYGDLDGNGCTELLETRFNAALNQMVPERQLEFLARGLPFLRARFPSNDAFSRATVDEMLGEYAAAARRLSVNWLDSTVLLNRGEHFEGRTLPIEAQMTAAFGVTVADFNGDGAEDIFLSQNFHAAQPDIPRLDAGRGLLLEGDGRGNFRAVPGQESGIQIYGEQRGAAVADYDQDGRPDLVVSQNGAETKLLRNVSGRPGLRVRLQGPPGNPVGAGAVLRWSSARSTGPARELHAGSGYWSHDSPVPVLAHGGVPGSLIVRWPDGKSTTNAVPAGAREVTVAPAGDLKVVR